MRTETTSCKECALWDRERAADKAGRVRHDLVAECLWRPVWAACIPEQERASLFPRYMQGSSGKECQQFQTMLGMFMPVKATMMILCDTCGNKRCPHSDDHRNARTGSNETGQPGSRYEHAGLSGAQG